MRWAFATLNAVVDAEVKALPADMQARFLRFAETIEQAGFEGLPRTASGISKASSGSFVWSVAMASRAPFTSRRQAAGLSSCESSSRRLQKTPPRELELARQRAKEII